MDAFFTALRETISQTPLGAYAIHQPAWVFAVAMLALPSFLWVLKRPFAAFPPSIARAILLAAYIVGAGTIALLARLDSETAGGIATLVFLVSAIPGAALLTPNRPSIVLLRRFHTETSRTAISRLFDFLAVRGFDCVTLADSVVRNDRVTLLVLSMVLAGALVLFCWVFAVAVILSVAFTPIVHALGFSAFTWIMIAISVAGTVLFATLGMNQVRWLSSKLVDLLQPPRFASEMVDRSGNPVLPKRFRKPWQGGLSVLITDDRDWRVVVQALIRSCHWVCVDLYSPSEFVAEELIYIAQQDRQDHVIWMTPDDHHAVSVAHDCYTILGQTFSGAPRLWRYPADLNLLDDANHKAIGRLSVEFEKFLLSARP